MTPQQKAAATRRRNEADRELAAVRRRAHEIRDAIAALPYDPASWPAVVAVFRPGDFDAFQMLDEKPGLFDGYPNGHWHALLRQVRNQPALGLFHAMRDE